MNILDIINTLKNAPRQGAVSDEPEGLRYIVMSDTLANKIAEALEEFLIEKEDMEFTRDTTEK